MVANEKSEQVKATEHSPSFSSSFCGNLFFFYQQDVSTKVLKTESSEGLYERELLKTTLKVPMSFLIIIVLEVAFTFIVLIRVLPSFVFAYCD